MHRSRHTRFVASALTLMLLATQVASVAAAPPSGTSRAITVSATGLTGLGSFTISAGQSVPLSITVANDGKQNINSVRLLVGLDASETTAANGDATEPVALPDHVTVGAAGCTGVSILACEIGTLRARSSVTFEVTIAVGTEATEAVAGDKLRTKAAVKVAEGGNDNGSNLDSFYLEGDLSILAYSCDVIAVYRPGSNAKDVATPCALDDARNGNRQNAAIRLPTTLTTATLKENPNASCPPVSGLRCIGDEVQATITGETRDHVIFWEIQIKGASVNLNKLVVYHYFDDGTFETIPLTRKNACKSAGATGCGAASMSGDVLTITIQTKGNGRTRILG
ncbi:hypothetical protein BH20CHL7_BH20CHL7_16790 [soil metagenome]